MAGGTEWAGEQAPSLADVERLAAAAWQRLPREFRDMCGDVVIRVEDFPDRRRSAGDEAREPLRSDGPLPWRQPEQQERDGPWGLPNMVFLYRRPMLDYWAEHHETLGDLVTHVLVHEIGHHFGLSDADMEHLEASAGG